MKKLKITPGVLLFSGLLAGELSVLLDVVFVLCGRALSVPKFAVMLAVLFAGVLLWPGTQQKMRKAAAMVLLAAVGLPLLIGTICWHGVSRSGGYTAVDTGKENLYAGKKVMLLVPHQDDDINVLGGVMEEYVKYGSEVIVVFSTNGDYYGQAEIRFREAINALENIGIPEDHVIFLGYGDQWERGGPHLYNGEPDVVFHSRIGYTETYGAEGHPSYRVGKNYTIDNFLEDIENVILEYRPDILYCVDYDYNIDHRALSMSFEKVMGKILKEQAAYRPLVLKGYAYNTAWEAENDFYMENLLSAQNVFAEPYHQQPEVYRWEERIRLPVNAESLSRSLISAEQNVTLSMYVSQNAFLYGPRVINSDKVFWQRHTDSLCHQAEIQTSSGAGNFLNDFMLLESQDLKELGDTPYDGVWIPEASDSEKQVTVTFLEPKDVNSIVLYDHPDPEKNVLNTLIAFPDGTSFETGALDPAGSATRFSVKKAKVSSFTIALTEVQGEAGLSEMEAYETSLNSEPSFVKIMDEDGNFVYDYWMDNSGEQRFLLYTDGEMPAAQEEYTLSCSNPACSAVWEGDTIRVTCPTGETCIVTVTSADASLSDSVFLRNPGKLERAWTMFWLRAEEGVLRLCETKRLHERLFVCRLYTKGAAALHGLIG